MEGSNILPSALDEDILDGHHKNYPEAPRLSSLSELRVGDIIDLMGLQMKVRKVTKKDIILRPLSKVELGAFSARGT